MSTINTNQPCSINDCLSCRPMFIAEAAGEYVADELDHLEFDHLIVLVILGSACLIPL